MYNGRNRRVPGLAGQSGLTGELQANKRAEVRTLEIVFQLQLTDAHAHHIHMSS